MRAAAERRGNGEQGSEDTDHQHRFLIVGNLIGAGILALPINTGLAGFLPSLLGLLVTSAAMYYSSLILSREAVDRKEPTFNYPSLYRNYLGKGGEWIAVVANLIILYGLLTAYLTGITSIIGNLFSLSVPPVYLMLGFFVVVSAISMADIGKIQKYIAVLVAVKCAPSSSSCSCRRPHQDQNLSHVSWPLSPAAYRSCDGLPFPQHHPGGVRDAAWDRKLIAAPCCWAWRSVS